VAGGGVKTARRSPWACPLERPADTAGMAKLIKRLPAGFIIPAQPVLASIPPSGTIGSAKSSTVATELWSAATSDCAALQPQRL
jgi:hypothetical protein